MTINEMVLYITDALNLSSADAKARVGRELNLYYKQVTSAIGLIPTRREEVSQAVSIGNRFVVFSGIEKIDFVFYVNNNRNVKLDEITHDEMMDLPAGTWPPTRYSIFSMTESTVTIMIDVDP